MQIVNEVNDALIHLRNYVNKKEIPKNENLDKVINIAEKILYTYIWSKQIVWSIIRYSEFPYIIAWFTDQNSKLLEIEDKINITLVIS